MIKDPPKTRERYSRQSQPEQISGLWDVITCTGSLEHLGRTRCEARNDEAGGTSKGQIRGPFTHSRNSDSLASNGEPWEDGRQAGM